MPVSDGYRLCLMYHLIQTGAGPAAMAPDRQPDLKKLQEAVRLWKADSAGPQKLVFELEHK